MLTERERVRRRAGRWFVAALIFGLIAFVEPLFSAPCVVASLVTFTRSFWLLMRSEMEY